MHFRLSSRLKIRSALLVVPFALAAFFVAPVTAANAATCGYPPSLPAGVSASTPYLSTGYGPVAHGVQASSGGWTSARPGFYSPISGGFSPSGSGVFLAVADAFYSKNGSVPSSDGVSAVFCGYVLLNTGYGQVSFGVQYSGTQGRWGNYNKSAGTFFPDSSGWQPLA